MPYKDREAKRAYNRAYHLAHLQELKIYQRIYRDTHKEEKREYNQTYYAEHAEECVEYARQYRKGHPEEIRARRKARYSPEKARVSNRQNYERHREKRRAQAREHRRRHATEISQRKRAKYLANPEMRRAQQRAWYAANAEKVRIQRRAFYAAHAERYFAYAAHYRARKQHVPVVEHVSLDVLYQRDKHACSLCHKHVKRSDASTDHIIPLSQGGSHTYANCALAHRVCNSRKRTSTRFPQQLGLF